MYLNTYRPGYYISYDAPMAALSVSVCSTERAVGCGAQQSAARKMPDYKIDPSVFASQSVPHPVSGPWLHCDLFYPPHPLFSITSLTVDCCTVYLHVGTCKYVRHVVFYRISQHAAALCSHLQSQTDRKSVV